MHQEHRTEIFSKIFSWLRDPREQNFLHSFLDSLNQIRSCGFNIKSSCHYLLHCPIFINKRISILETISNIYVDALSQNDANIVRILFCGVPSLKDLTNTLILNASIQFLFPRKDLDDSLI